MGLAVWNVAVFLVWKDDYLFNAILGLAILFGAISNLIAIPILRRRVTPPCIRVRRHRAAKYNIIMSFLVIAFVIFLLIESLHSFRMLLLLGPMIASLIIYNILILFEKIEICGNGVWGYGGLRPWEEYESFYWKWKTKDSVELRLVSKSWRRPTRLMARPEDREAVQKLLEANLPDTT